MRKTLFGFDIEGAWSYENGFYLTSHYTRMAKLLAHYELYRSIVSLPGQVVECGVYKGASLIRFLTFRQILESPFSRKIVGFDAFGAFPEQKSEEDRAFAARFEAQGGHGISVHELEEVLAHKSFTNYELVQGDVCATVPEYVQQHPELKIALLHIDVDVYEPSVTILEELYGRVVRGGLVMFDDYGTVAGETRAIDAYLQGTDAVIEKLPISHIPAYIRRK